MDRKKTEIHPRTAAGFLSRLNFWWVSKLIAPIRERPFEQHMHPALTPDEDVGTREAEFASAFGRTNSLFGLMISFFDLKLATVGSMLLFASLEVGQIGIVNWMTLYIQSLGPNKPLDKQVLGLFFAGVVVTQYLTNLVLNHFVYKVGIRMVILKNQFMLKIIKRVFQINLKASDQTSRGNVINLIQVDCANIETDGVWACYAVYGVLTFLTTFTLGALFLGWAFWIYVGVYLVLSVFIGVAFGGSARMEREMLKAKDQRISELTNILSNIRFVKFQAMEDFFIKVVHMIRGRELYYIKATFFFFAVFILLMWISPNLSATAMYTSYFGIYGVPTNDVFLTAQQLQNTAQMVFMILPGSLVMVFKFVVMFGRMRKFFDIREYDTSYISKNPAPTPQAATENYAIELENCQFSFNNEEQEVFNKACEDDNKKKEEPAKGTDQPPAESGEALEGNLEKKEEEKKARFSLQIPSLKVEKGKVVFVIGRIGSGKSAFIQSLMGELSASQTSRVAISGSVTYCSQQPFLMTKTIQENITFYRPFDAERLERAVTMADLVPDLSSFDDGVNKVLNEGAMNVSGGQRSRINLARCFYEPADIYLLDDPFSALDVHVACRIIEQSVLTALKGTTRVIVTHSIQYLNYADTVIYMDQGTIGFQGSFQDFKQTRQFEELQKTIAKESSPLPSQPVPRRHLDLSRQKTGERSAPHKSGHRSSQLTESPSLLSASNKSDISAKIRDQPLDAPEPEPHRPEITQQEYRLPLQINSEPSRLDAFISKYFLEEDRHEGRQFGLFIQLIKRYFGGLKYIVLLILLCGIPKLIFYYANAYLVNWIEVYQKGGSQVPMWPTLMEYAIAMIAPNLLILIRMLTEFFICYRASKILHEKMLIRVVYADLLGFFDKVDAGRLINRFSKDIASLDKDLSNTYGQFCVAVAMFLVTVIVMGVSLTGYVWGAVILFMGLLLYYQNEFVKVKKEVRRLEAITKSPIVSLTNEIIAGRQVIRSFGQETQVLAEMREKMNENSKNVIFRMGLESWFNMKLLNYGVLMTQMFTFGVFLYTVKPEELSVKVVLGIIYVFGFVDNLTYASNNLSSLEANFVAVERCDAFGNIPIEDRYTNWHRHSTLLQQRLPHEELKAFVVTKTPNFEAQRFTYEQINTLGFNRSIFTRGKIEFKDVWATYPMTEQPALKGINLVLEPGMKLGVAGKTGSGKTSLIKLLTRYLKQTKGEVLIDGYDIGQMDLKQLRSEMLVISQEIALFEGTILENMNPEFIERKSKAAKKGGKGAKSGLEEALLVDEKSEEQRRLEQEISDCLIKFGFSSEKMAKEGLNFRVALGGDNLSPGEQQLIAIFRALFTNKKIIILDEATASIDYETEKAITEYLYQKIKNKTMIAIAHRVNTIMGCDQIVILEQGVVVERGAPQALLQDPQSRFGAMYRQLNTNMESKEI